MGNKKSSAKLKEKLGKLSLNVPKCVLKEKAKLKTERHYKNQELRRQNPNIRKITNGVPVLFWNDEKNV